jgi:hypothetical protein
VSDSLLSRIASELATLFQPIADAVEDPSVYGTLLSGLGVSPSDGAAGGIFGVLKPLAELKTEITALAANPAPSFDGIAHLLESAKNAFTAIRGLSSSGGAGESLTGLGEDLARFLVTGWFLSNYPLLYDLFVLLTIVEPPENAEPTATVIESGQIRRTPTFYPEFHFERLSPLLHDPATVLSAKYSTALATVDDANAMADALFPRLANVLNDLGIAHIYGITERDRAQLGDAAALVDHSLLIYLQSMASGDALDAGVSLALSSADRGDLGLVVSPFGGLSYTAQSGNWSVTATLTADIAAFAYGKSGVTIVASAAAAQIDAGLAATLASPNSGPAFVFGSTDGSRLEIGGAKVSLDTTLSEAAQSLALGALVSKSSIVIAGGDGDGFVSRLLPKDGLRADFDLGLTWSNTAGLAFHGAAGLEATIPLNVSLGGVFLIPSAHLALQADDQSVSLEVSASVGLSIGPMAVVVDRLGVLTIFDFSSGGGSAGIGDFGIAFKPPSGAGLSIDAAGVSGGGFLEHDPTKHEYLGVLQLQFNTLALQAFGLITTQVAGASGYSILALVDANFPPIQLGWGFTLNGVGGLLAMHRTADTDALGAALKADKLATILFPKSAIADAPAVLSELDTLFPTAPGRFLFGPMALIGWGSPTLVTIAIALVFELPDPIRVILLARIAARLPSESHAVVRINVDALGVLDIAADSLSLDAVLYDSHILTFNLTGGMALRANWGSQPEFVLAIGGVHPQYTPPPGFPALARIAIDMPSGNIAKMRLAAYIAMTANTVQFGADLDVFIGVSGYGLAGHLSFDALLGILPFQFKADISASVALMAGGDDLMSVELDGSICGPGPWTIAGSFKIHLLFFDLHKSFTYSTGESASAPAIPPVDAAALLATAFADPRNWGARLPAHTPALVSTLSADGTTVIAHPLAILDVHETVVPLDLAIDRMGAAALAGASTFSITAFSIGTSTVTPTAIQADFAPAQFLNLTDTEKLARPSFEPYDAGVAIGSLPASAGLPVSKTIAYDTFYVDEPLGPLRRDAAPRSDLFAADIQAMLHFGASGGAAIRTAGTARYVAPGNPIVVAPFRFVVADRSTLAAVGTASGSTYGAAAAAVLPGLQVVATYEVAAA